MVPPSSSSASLNSSRSAVKPKSEKERDAVTTISSAFASMMAVGAPHHSHNGPFNIGPLRIDEGTGKGERDRSRKKSHRLSGFTKRSMSPFRFGKRSSRKHNGETESDSEYGTRSEREKDSDTESVASSATGITPRNSAFDVHDDDEDHPRIISSGRIANAISSPALRPALSRGNSASSLRSVEDSHGVEADVESIASDISDDEKDPVSTSVDDADEHEFHHDDEDDIEDDESVDSIVLDNTLYNAECLTDHQHWGGDAKSDDGHHHFETYEDENLEYDDEHITAPNVVLAEDQVSPFLQRRGSKMLPLIVSRPKFERNRCTIVLSHGDYEAAARTSKRPKRYVVASDGSEESSYAAEWTIGTVLRDGDEMLVVSVMETDAKLDALDPKHEEISARLEHQRIRQAMASVLSKQATHLLERTRLEVKISCQAIHAKNSRHMLLDLIDFFEPTMVIVGSRGLGSLRGILLGSTSHYLVQKSSAPVMVVRKRLKLPALPRGKGDVVESVRARHMRLDQASIEKVSNANESAEAEAATAAVSKAAKEDDSSPSDEARGADPADVGEDSEADKTENKAITTGKTASPGKSVDGLPSTQGDSPKGSLVRKASKSGSVTAPTVIPQNSLDREAETRSEIKQRKQEAAKLHEDDKKKHLLHSHSHSHAQMKLRASERENESTGDEAESVTETKPAASEPKARPNTDPAYPKQVRDRADSTNSTTTSS
ncbi:hypothetical protein BCV70DRAFT_230084 [Testicularia cyperi]|uniref:UspA domain-containing protein n=1 Tax=Testicularia cyperi TaxID=1882483 RepID=A0A317XX18_9BASI|nr:hypothetical protein BCV70DRAFT_230084 [Testicularia cyperi]